MHLGVFSTAEDAARAYDAQARALGRRPNFDDDSAPMSASSGAERGGAGAGGHARHVQVMPHASTAGMQMGVPVPSHPVHPKVEAHLRDIQGAQRGSQPQARVISQLDPSKLSAFWKGTTSLHFTSEQCAPPPDSPGAGYVCAQQSGFPTQQHVGAGYVCAHQQHSQQATPHHHPHAQPLSGVYTAQPVRQQGQLMGPPPPRHGGLLHTGPVHLEHGPYGPSGVLYQQAPTDADAAADARRTQQQPLQPHPAYAEAAAGTRLDTAALSSIAMAVPMPQAPLLQEQQWHRM